MSPLASDAGHKRSGSIGQLFRDMNADQQGVGDDLQREESKSPWRQGRETRLSLVLEKFSASDPS